MPGLDGTGELFDGLREQLPAELDVAVVRYPHDQNLGYSELRRFVVSAIEGATAVVLFAESFSSPLAIEMAANGSDNFAGVVLCAGFAAAPVSSFARMLLRRVKPFSFQPPDWIVRHFLVGPQAPETLVKQVKRTINSVPPHILEFRLNQILECSALQAMAEVSAPTLYIQGTADRLVASSALKEIEHANSKVVCNRVEGPHLLAQANPSGVATAVLNFLQTLA